MYTMADKLKALGFMSSKQLRADRDKAIGNLARGNRTSQGRFTSESSNRETAVKTARILRSSHS